MPKQHRIVLIHGVRYKQKDRDNLLQLALAFQDAGFVVLAPTYGYMPAFIVGFFHWLDDRIADTISGFIEEGDILLGHSNGATLVYLISKKVKINGAILVNPALDPADCPEAPFTQVYWNSGDWVASLSALVPFHPWGNMGSAGYLGSDPRVTNIDCGNPPDGLPKLEGHSDMFTPVKIRAWARYLAQRCLSAIATVTSGNYHD